MKTLSVTYQERRGNIIIGNTVEVDAGETADQAVERAKTFAHEQLKKHGETPAPSAPKLRVPSGGDPKEKLEFDCRVIQESDTGKGMKIEINGQKKWYPKSQIELTVNQDRILIPRWLAEQQEII